MIEVGNIFDLNNDLYNVTYKLGDIVLLKKMKEKAAKEPVRTWSPWKYVGTLRVAGYHGIPLQVRDNGKSLQVRTKVDDKFIKAKASCHPNDQFNEVTGKHLALMRLRSKIYKTLANNIAAEM